MSLNLRKMRRQRFRGTHTRSFSWAEWEDRAALARFFDGLRDAIGDDLERDVLAERDYFNDRIVVRWARRPL